MDNDDVKTFTYRISQANRTELVVVCYDIILKDIDEAMKLSEGDTIASVMTHAVRFVNELMGTLDFRYELSYKLRQLYVYVQRELIAVQFGHCNARENNTFEAAGATKGVMDSKEAPPQKPQKDVTDRLKNARTVIEGLRLAFYEAAKSDTSKPLMQNVQQVYAGLTYGKNSLVETELDAEAGGRRGFLA